MNFINKVELQGTIGRVTNTNIADKLCTRFSMATNYCYKDRDGNAVIETTWHNVVAFAGENTVDAPNLNKGDKVLVKGRIQNRNYITESGEPKQITEIFANEVRIIENGQFKNNTEK